MAKAAIAAAESTFMSNWREKVIDAGMGLFCASGAHWLAEPFTRGYQRGRDYYQRLCDESKAA